MLSKAYRTPREIDERDLVFDARPKTAVEAAEEAIDDMKKVHILDSVIDQTEDLIRQAQDEPPLGVLTCSSPIDAIAELILGLTYGEMIELAGELWHLREVGDLTEQNLPQILWDWAQWKKTS